MRTEILRKHVILSVVARDLESSRPLDAVELLRAAADDIESAYEAARLNNPDQPWQPFLIDEITVDLYYGVVSIYYHEQSEQDFEP